MSQDLFDLLNIPDSPDQQLFTPEPCEQPHESGSASVPHSPAPLTLPPASKKSFQKDILKLMMDGIKISLVGRRPTFLPLLSRHGKADLDGSPPPPPPPHRAALAEEELPTISGEGSCGRAGILSGYRSAACSCTRSAPRFPWPTGRRRWSLCLTPGTWTS